jgi:hypothetical protein
MAVGFDAKMNAGNGTGGLCQVGTGITTLTSATGMTVGAGASILVAVLAFYCPGSAGPTARTLTWNGVSMTEAITDFVVLGGADSLFCSIWTLNSPASGAKALVAGWTTNCDLYMSCGSFTGASLQSADNTVANNVTTISIPTDANGATIGLFNTDGGAPTTNFVQIFSDAPFGPGAGASYQLGGAGTNGHTYTGAGGTKQILTGIHLVAAGGGPVSSLMGQASL